MNCLVCACLSFAPIHKNKYVCLCGHEKSQHDFPEEEKVKVPIMSDMATEMKFNPEKLPEEKINENYEIEHPHNCNMPVLREINRYVIDDKNNIMIGVTGRVGRGKSHTAIKIIDLWNPKFSPKDYVVFTVEELMDKTLSYITVNGEPLNKANFEEMGDIKEWLKQHEKDIHIRPGMPLVFDEAGSGAFVRDFFSQDNKNISKIVQMWRFLRMVVFVIVPENMGIAEKNLRTFMDVEIRMIRVDRRRKEATAIAWEYFNKSDPDNPMKQRIPGCQSGGKLHIKPLDDDKSEEYENMARVHKLSALMELKKGKETKKATDGRRARVSFEDAYKAAKENGWTKVGEIMSGTHCSNSVGIQVRQKLKSETIVLRTK